MILPGMHMVYVKKGFSTVDPDIPDPESYDPLMFPTQFSVTDSIYYINSVYFHSLIARPPLFWSVVVL